MIPLPPNAVRFNGGVRCDMLLGPCACGATHTVEPDGDAHRRLLDLLAGWRDWALKCSENEADEVGPTTYLAEVDEIMAFYQEAALRSCPTEATLLELAGGLISLVMTGTPCRERAQK